MKLVSAAAAYEYLIERVRLDIEEFWTVALTADKEVIHADFQFRGTVDSCLFHPRDVFRFGCRHNAAALLIAHTHPSGNPFPSTEDQLITRQVMLAADLLQIPIVDHLVVAKHCYYSFLESKALPQLHWQKSMSELLKPAD